MINGNPEASPSCSRNGFVQTFGVHGPEVIEALAVNFDHFRHLSVGWLAESYSGGADTFWKFLERMFQHVKLFLHGKAALEKARNLGVHQGTCIDNGIAGFSCIFNTSLDRLCIEALKCRERGHERARVGHVPGT